MSEEFRGQGRQNRLSPELEELANLYYDTGRYIRLPEMESSIGNDNTKQRTEGTAYTEGGLVYLPEQNRGNMQFFLCFF